MSTPDLSMANDLRNTRNALFWGIGISGGIAILVAIDNIVKYTKLKSQANKKEEFEANKSALTMMLILSILILTVLVFGFVGFVWLPKINESYLKGLIAVCIASLISLILAILLKVYANKIRKTAKGEEIKKYMNDISLIVLLVFLLLFSVASAYKDHQMVQTGAYNK